MTSSLLPAGRSIEKLPLKSVIVPVLVPFTTIETPISGSPLSSMIVPFTVFVCVTTCTIVLETPSSAYTEYDRGADNKDSPKIMEARL